jgi:UDP-glucose 4-epimerase
MLPNFEKATVLVIGGLGFIGSNLVRKLVDLGAQVSVIDAMLPNCGGRLFNVAGYENQIEIHLVDLARPEGLESILTGKSHIFNVAGRVSHVDSMTHPIADLDANVLAQINLLEACRRHAPNATVVYASTRQIYGKPVQLPVNEDHPLRPVDVNGVNKMAGEAYHTLYHDVYGLRSVALRMTNTFGPRMRVKDARQTFLGVWLRAIVENRPFEVWGGKQLRDFSYIDDAVSACLAAAGCPQAWGRAFNLGGSPPISLIELADRLVEIAGDGRYDLREFPPERKIIDIGDYYADDSRFRELTGWRAEVSLDDGLRRTVDYYRKNLRAYV